MRNDTVNSEIFARILFLQIALKDVFATFQIRDDLHKKSKPQNDFSVSRVFNFTKLRENKTLAKIPNLQHTN